MELVYLWVEDYKNIHKQGFNFSPRFECNYDEVTNKLTIDENKEYESIFPKNINVTAIVGENGSGKSSLLELISNIILNIEIKKKVLISVSHNDRIICFTQMRNLQVLYPLYTVQELNDISNYDLFSVFYSSNFTNGNLNSILELFTTPFFRTHSTSSTNYDGHGYKNDNLKVQSLLNLVFNSSRVLDFHPTHSAGHKHSFTIKQQQENYEISKIIFILQFLKHFSKEYLPLNLTKSDKVTISIQHNSYTVNEYERSFINKITKLISLKTEFYGSTEEKEKYYKKINIEKYNQSKKMFLTFLSKYTNDLKDYDKFTLGIDESLEFIDLYIDLYRYNRNLENSLFDFKFKYFSSGEENLVLMFALLERGISSYTDKKLITDECNVILMLDEIENNFHVVWQKKLFSHLVDFLNLISFHWTKEQSKKLTFSILLTSHSPFLLSDLPKENVIFLEKGKHVYPDIETFGANIHTLLSHGFFMKDDGLMGEFAKGKINETIKFLNKEKSEIKTEKEAKNIIDKIGEPFLKEKLRELYDTNYPPSKEEKIQRLREQIKELENAHS